MARQRERAKELLARLEHDIDPDTLVDDLRIGEQQIVEIAKALADDVKVLIMDEPTSALSASEVEVLFRVIAELKKSGVAIIYISHRLEELVRIGDYFTVLRDGHFQAAAPKGEATIPWIIRQMLGTSEFAKRQARDVKVGDTVLSVENMKLPRVGGGYLVDDVSVNFRAGEIVGIYGLLGAGRSELFEACSASAPRRAARWRSTASRSTSCRSPPVSPPACSSCRKIVSATVSCRTSPSARTSAWRALPR